MRLVSNTTCMCLYTRLVVLLTRVWVEKIPKKVKNRLRKAREMFYQTNKVFLSDKKDLKQCKRLKERQRNPKQTRLSPVESPILL